MKEAEFQTLNPVADSVDEQCDAWFSSPGMESVKDALKGALTALPSTYSLELAVELRVFDSEREKSVRLLTVGLNSHGSADPYRTSGDSTAQRYIVDGELCELPGDYCPRCWGAWDFKLEFPVCPECRAELGPDIKVLLDRDVCPNCDEGAVSIRQLTCAKCGFNVNPDFVIWG